MQKFSFLSNVIYYQAGQELEVHSKYQFETLVTITVSSSYSDLDNQVFQIKPHDSLIFKYRPKVAGFIKAIRVWGAVWDFDGFLDLDFKNIAATVETPQVVVTPSLGVSKQITQTYYDYNGWTKIEQFKQITSDNQTFTFLLSEHNNASYSVTCDSLDFAIENSNLYFTAVKEQYVQITTADLTDIGVCMSVMFGGNIYNLEGAQNINELEQELYLAFANDGKLRVYRQADSILIYSDYVDRNKMKFFGVTKFFNKIFQGISNNKVAVNVKCLNRNWHYKKVEFNIIANGLVRRPKMIVHFENVSTSEYSFELENDLIVGEETKIYLNSTNAIANKFLQTSNNIICNNNFSMQDSYNKVFWYIQPTSNDDATVSVKDILTETFNVADKPEILDLLYSLQITKEEVVLKIYLNKAVSYDYDYDIKFQDKLSKLDQDYRLSTSYHTINAGQLDRKERIVWTTAQTLRSFNIVLDGKVIAVNWFDRNYYPNNISLRNDDNIKHFVNRSISRPLTLQYVDGDKIGTIMLNANATDWSYQATTSNVLWQVYDTEYLIFQQNITYVTAVDKKPFLKMVFDDSINSKSINYLTIKLDWPVKYDVDFELAAISSADIKISGKYRFKADQTEMKFRLTPIRLKSKPTFLSLQIISASLDFDNRKYSIVIN